MSHLVSTVVKLVWKLTKLGFYGGLLAFIVAIAIAAAAYFYLVPKLPDVATLRNVELQVPLRVYSADGLLIGEFGETKRTPVEYDDIPQMMRDAFVAAEDDRFFSHKGVDIPGLARAVFELLRTGEKRQGGSTITMQLARNFFLSNEKTYLRKLNEILLALKIEKELSKQEIFTLYLNKIFLGQRAYGVAAAAQVYYGAELDELSLAQTAMIAGLPKAPSTTNPVSNPERARARRDYVLGRMRALAMIDEDRYEAAKQAPVSARLHGATVELSAAYVAEMTRQEMHDRFGDDAYSKGYKVYTTIDPQLQLAAQQALRQTLLAYDKRHGYRGPERSLGASGIDSELTFDEVGGLQAAIVVALEDRQVIARLKNQERVTIDWNGLNWARPYIDENRRGAAPRAAKDIVALGDVIRVVQNNEGQWTLTQIPQVQGAILAPEATTGAIRALVGGFDFNQSKFNRASQAQRQVGSSFKPFIYSAALDYGYTAASLINDAPVVFDDPGLDSVWRPQNYGGEFAGPIRMRVALRESRNLVSIRLLQSVGINGALEHISKFGFDRSKLPKNLSLALGSVSMTPLELSRGYLVLANGGFAVEPYLIQRIEDVHSEIIYQAEPEIACNGCEPAPTQLSADAFSTDAVTETADITLPASKPAKRAVSAQNIYLMNDLLRDVIRSGTGKRARALQRADIAGKTGTTNDQRDAWFAGFNQDIVAISWVGFDDSSPLGANETGASAALPMWIQFMETALSRYPERPLPRPEGLISVRIDAETGLQVEPGHHGAIFETFRAEQVPDKLPAHDTSPYATGGAAKGGRNSGIPEQLF